MTEGVSFSITAPHDYERETILPDGELNGNTIDDRFEGLFYVKSSSGSKGMVLQKKGSMVVKGRLMQSDQTDMINYSFQVKFDQ